MKKLAADLTLSELESAIARIKWPDPIKNTFIYGCSHYPMMFFKLDPYFLPIWQTDKAGVITNEITIAMKYYPTNQLRNDPELILQAESDVLHWLQHATIVDEARAWLEWKCPEGIEV